MLFIQSGLECPRQFARRLVLAATTFASDNAVLHFIFLMKLFDLAHRLVGSELLSVDIRSNSLWRVAQCLVSSTSEVASEIYVLEAGLLCIERDSILSAVVSVSLYRPTYPPSRCFLSINLRDGM